MLVILFFKGDSGGPLMCERDGKWYLSGVVSWGPILCGKKPSVFTNVAEYTKWIGNIVTFRGKSFILFFIIIIRQLTVNSYQ